MCLRALQLQPEIPRKPHVPPVGAGVAERAEYCSGRRARVRAPGGLLEVV